MAIADLMRDVKSDSTEFINRNRCVRGRFHWQEGYGAFSIGESQVPQLMEYISEQKAHHHKHDFKHEFRSVLERYKVEYDERYVWD
jgi:hypothetical protein